MNHQTLGIIKPDAVGKNYTGKIIDRILQSGFQIKAMRLMHLSTRQAKEFYEVHKEKPFYNDLVQFMTSGPSVALVLQKENAVSSWRDIMGATNPEEAEKDTIRKDFAESIQNNAVHGSDSEENSRKEIAFFFSDNEIPG